MTTAAMDGTGQTEQRELTGDLKQWPLVWDSEYDAWNERSDHGDCAEGQNTQRESSLETESRVVVYLGAANMMLCAPETTESLGPLLERLVEWRKQNTDVKWLTQANQPIGAEQLRVCNISDRCWRRSGTPPHGTATRKASWDAGRRTGLVLQEVWTALQTPKIC